MTDYSPALRRQTLFLVFGSTVGRPTLSLPTCQAGKPDLREESCGPTKGMTRRSRPGAECWHSVRGKRPLAREGTASSGRRAYPWESRCLTDPERALPRQPKRDDRLCVSRNAKYGTQAASRLTDGTQRHQSTTRPSAQLSSSRKTKTAECRPPAGRKMLRIPALRNIPRNREAVCLGMAERSTKSLA